MNIEQLTTNLGEYAEQCTRSVEELKQLPSIKAYFLGKEDFKEKIETELRKRKYFLLKGEEIEKMLDDNTIKTIKRMEIIKGNNNEQK